ncbi:MAG: hypothetical protein V5A62_01990 [Haloarculaceae archaeon]
MAVRPRQKPWRWTRTAIPLPANHHPLALGERAVPDEAGVEWRVVDSDRPDEAYLLREVFGVRYPGD